MTDIIINFTDDVIKAAADLQLTLLNKDDIPDNANSLIFEYLISALENIADAGKVLHGLPWYE